MGVEGFCEVVRFKWHYSVLAPIKQIRGNKNLQSWNKKKKSKYKCRSLSLSLFLSKVWHGQYYWSLSHWRELISLHLHVSQEVFFHCAQSAAANRPDYTQEEKGGKTETPTAGKTKQLEENIKMKFIIRCHLDKHWSSTVAFMCHCNHWGCWGGNKGFNAFFSIHFTELLCVPRQGRVEGGAVKAGRELTHTFIWQEYKYVQIHEEDTSTYFSSTGAICSHWSNLILHYCKVGV